MNQTHVHLLINHLPIFGSILGGLVLGHGLWTRNHQTKIAAYYVLIISSLGAVISYLTGEAAEESVEHLQGVSHDLIHQHEDLAVYALVALCILGIASLIGIFLTLKKSPLTRTFAVVTFFISITSFGLIARTGYIGGQIRHTEINSSNNTPASNIEQGNDDD